MYLLDTVVLSEMRKRSPDSGVVRWFGAREPASLFISTITVGEIERGAALRRSQDAVFADALSSWLEQLLADYRDRIIPVDIRIARCWGRLGAIVGHSGVDLLIAATAIEHDFTVVTRNVRHFAPTGVPVENPFT
jgi:toxin FitB